MFLLSLSLFFFCKWKKGIRREDLPQFSNQISCLATGINRSDFVQSVWISSRKPGKITMQNYVTVFDLIFRKIFWK